MELEENKRASGLFYPAVRSGIPSLEPEWTGSTLFNITQKNVQRKKNLKIRIPTWNVPDWRRGFSCELRVVGYQVTGIRRQVSGDWFQVTGVRC